jgi:hypothetical protein
MITWPGAWAAMYALTLLTVIGQPSIPRTGSGYLETQVIGAKRGALVGYRREALRSNPDRVMPPPSLRRDHEMSETTDETWWTELASRESNGIMVRLFWSRPTNVVTVAVADAANDEYFELVLEEHERALDVFHHPFAHAAARGFELRTDRPEREPLHDAA